MLLGVVIFMIIFLYESEYERLGLNIDSIGILQEFIECIKLLNISEADRVKYLKAICNYLQEELDQTYGAEITTDK